MNKIFENSDLKYVSDYIAQAESDIDIVLKGNFFGTLKICNKHNILVNINGDDANIYGTIKITAECEKHSEHICKVQLKKGKQIERVWINGERYIMARYPNISPNEKCQKYCSLSEAMTKLNSSINPCSAYVRGLHTAQWGGNGYTITRNNGEISLNWIGNNNRGDKISESNVILENLFEELDYPFEFYYDNNTGLLYFYNENEADKEVTIEYAVNQTLVEIDNCSATITISGLNFKNTDNSMFKSKWQRYLRSDWAYNFSSCVVINSSNNVTINNCTFSELGNNGVLIRNNSSYIVVADCIFSDCFSNGILVSGDKSSTYCSSSWDNENHITHMESPDKTGVKNDNYPKNIVISNCLFEWLGLQDLQSAGVCISLAHKVTVKLSTFRHLPRAGINIAENSFGGHLILNNDLYDCVRETGDHGPFNSWGRDRFWSLKKFNTSGKYGKEKKKFALSDMLDRNKIVSNRVIGTHGFGIDLDDGSSAYDIKNNFCVGVGIKLREGFYRVVENNVIINAAFDYHCAYAENGDIIRNNIVCNDEVMHKISENNGSNAIFENNYQVSKSNKNEKEFQKSVHLSRDEVIAGKYNLPGIKPLSTDYGRKGLSEPDINFDVNLVSAQILKKWAYTLSTVDESIRTVTGAPGYNGLYITRASKISKLYRWGLRKGDLIIKIDNEEVTTHNFSKLIKHGKYLTVYKNQRENAINL